MRPELHRLLWLLKQKPRPALEKGTTSRAVRMARRVPAYPWLSWDGVKVCLTAPECRLIVYGTLAPEGEYHHLLADLPATWEVCTIRGYMGTYRGYKAFQWHPGGPEHQAWLVTSPALPERCARLDRFEGQAYRRRLIPARLRTCLVIAQIYEAKRFV